MPDLHNQLDTHCHLDQFADSAKVAADAQAAGLRLIAVSLCPADWQRNCDRYRDEPHVFPAVGLLPQELDRHHDQVPMLIDAIATTRFIGEVGLDYVTEDATVRQRQRNLFDRILTAAASARDRILTIHSRRAADDVVAAIGSDFPGKAILHWYSGPLRNVENAPNSHWFSVNTAMATSRSGRRVIAAAPPDRLLLESDGPYVTVGDSPATPTDLHLVLERIAAIRNWPLDDTRARLAANAQQLLA